MIGELDMAWNELNHLLVPPLFGRCGVRARYKEVS